MFKFLSFVFLVALFYNLSFINIMIFYPIHFIIAVAIESFLLKSYNVDLKFWKLKQKINSFITEWLCILGFDEKQEFHRTKNVRKNRRSRRSKSQKVRSEPKVDINASLKFSKKTKKSNTSNKDFYQFIRIPLGLNCYKEFFCKCNLCKMNFTSFCQKYRCRECTPEIYVSQPYKTKNVVERKILKDFKHQIMNQNQGYKSHYERFQTSDYEC